jgi:hypothetical protein
MTELTSVKEVLQRVEADAWARTLHDPINHPKHYTSHPSGIECIQITEHMSFNAGNVIKYVWRADGKGGVEDLRKARWYLDREIARLEKSKGKAE